MKRALSNLRGLEYSLSRTSLGDFIIWTLICGGLSSHSCVSIPNTGLRHRNKRPRTASIGFLATPTNATFMEYKTQSLSIAVRPNTLQSPESQADIHFSGALGRRRPKYICNILPPGLKIQDSPGSKVWLPSTSAAVSTAVPRSPPC